MRAVVRDDLPISAAASAAAFRANRWLKPEEPIILDRGPSTRRRGYSARGALCLAPGEHTGGEGSRVHN